MRTLVMGIGNILRGDDGIGIAVVDALKTQTLPEHVTVLDAGTPGFELVLLMQDYDHVIVIDAADMDARAGTWRVFAPDEVKLRAGDLYLRGTLHYAGLAEALNLGTALGILPPKITIIGIQPQVIDWQQGLSACVADVIPTICAVVRDHLHESAPHA